jgi:hypothetical protein
MDPDQKAKIYVATLKKILNSKNEGFKTFGALTGGALGSGVGGTVGLVKTINKHREGEMDDLDNVDKIKEYLKSMGGHAAAGLGAGALLGTGLGAAGKIRKVYRESRPGVDHIMEELKDPKGPLYMADAGKGAIRTAKKQPLFNMMNATKEQLQSMLGKKANEVYPTGFRRLFGGTGAAMGGAAGGVTGGVLGGLKGLIAPGEEKDESTGKMVQRDRIKAMLSDAGKGGLIGGGIGAGAGLAGGAHLGHEFRSIDFKGIEGNILKNLLVGGKEHRQPGYRREIMRAVMTDLKNHPADLLQRLKERMGKTASAVPGVVPTGGPFNRVTGLKRNAARFYGTSGGLVGAGVGAVGGALKGLVSPDEEVDPATGKKVEQGRLYSALTGGLKGGLIGGGIGAGLGAAGGAMRGAQLHPHFVAGANALHKANPNHLGPAAAVAGQVHVPYSSFAPYESMRIKQYLADLQAKMSATPATP